MMFKYNVGDILTVQKGRPIDYEGNAFTKRIMHWYNTGDTVRVEDQRDHLSRPSYVCKRLGDGKGQVVSEEDLILTKGGHKYTVGQLLVVADTQPEYKHYFEPGDLVEVLALAGVDHNTYRLKRVVDGKEQSLREVDLQAVEDRYEPVTEKELDEVREIIARTPIDMAVTTARREYVDAQIKAEDLEREARHARRAAAAKLRHYEELLQRYQKEGA